MSSRIAEVSLTLDGDVLKIYLDGYQLSYRDYSREEITNEELEILKARIKGDISTETFSQWLKEKDEKAKSDMDELNKNYIENNKEELNRDYNFINGQWERKP